MWVRWSFKVIKNGTTRLIEHDSSSIATVAVSCIISEIKRDIGPKKLFIPLPFNLYDNLEPLRFSPKLLIQTVRVSKLLDRAKISPKSSNL